MIPERLAALREKMRAYGVDAYLVPTADYHESEYVGTYFKSRTYITGFTGSAGTAVITQEEACLWTDGRYFVQAAKELAGTGVTLMKMGQEGVPTVEEYLQANTKEGMTIGFDGRVVNEMLGETLEKTLPERFLSYRSDLIGEIWSDRPALSAEPVWILDSKYTGESAADRLAKVREKMKENGAEVHILTALDDIAWMLNIRGNDIIYNPVVLSYVIVKADEVIFYVQDGVVSDEIKNELEKAGVILRPYFAIYEEVKTLAKDSKILLDEGVVNYTLFENLPEKVTTVNAMNPTKPAKAMKNAVEMENERIAHIKDARAMCRFIYWLKKTVPEGTVDEYNAAEKSREFREEDADCLDLSFETICAYGPNAAMCHYAPSKEACAKVEPKGFFLIDSGGQYWQGTTDITRTIAVGPLSEEEKKHFTLVLKGNIRLAMAKFPYGVGGAHLDILARSALWDAGLDFNHGTGHGVGYLLNVHEGPQNINWNSGVRPGGMIPFEEGVLISDEPGLYLEGKYGIRCENLLICKKAEKNDYAQFMNFETVTLVPFEREAIIPELLGETELKWLNEYHKHVYEVVEPLLENKEEKEWLREATAEIK